MFCRRKLIQRCAIVWMLAVASGPGECLAVDVVFYVPHEGDAVLWDEVVAAVWLGEGVETALWPGEWPPDIGSAGAVAGVTLPDDRCLCWLDEGPATPSLVAYMTDWDRPVTQGVDATGLSHEELVKVAVILTMSLKRGIAISDSGWVPPPVAEAPAEEGASVSATSEPVIPPDEEAVTVDETVVPPVAMAPPRTTVEVGLGGGVGLRTESMEQAGAASVRLAILRGGWFGPGIQVSGEFGRQIGTSDYSIRVQRVTVAARWQFTPRVRQVEIPMAVGVGFTPIAVRLIDETDGGWMTAVLPTASAEAGLRFAIQPGVQLGLRLEATFDLQNYQIEIQRDGAVVDNDGLHWFAFIPKLEIVFGSR